MHIHLTLEMFECFGVMMVQSIKEELLDTVSCIESLFYHCAFVRRDIHNLIDM
jgi:hypothetical protein